MLQSIDSKGSSFLEEELHGNVVGLAAQAPLEAAHNPFKQHPIFLRGQLNPKQH